MQNDTESLKGDDDDGPPPLEKDSALAIPKRRRRPGRRQRYVLGFLVLVLVLAALAVGASLSYRRDSDARCAFDVRDELIGSNLVGV
jgi:hypothetical protein